MTNSVDLASDKPELARLHGDRLLGLSLLATLPLVVVFCSDLWFRSDLRFFPLLMFVPIGLAVWRSRRPQPDANDSNAEKSDGAHMRELVSLGLWMIGGVSATCAPLFFSPWLAVLGLTLGWIAWTLTRFDRTPWPRLLKWTLPLVVLLLLPLGERSNLVPNFSSNLTYASSSLLDLLGIDHLPSQQTLQLGVGRYDVASVCRGLGNPYLMLSLVVLMCMGMRCSLSVGLLTSASAPLWSWAGSLLLIVSSVWLAEQQNVFFWSGLRLGLVQAIALIGGLLSALLFKRAMQTLLTPFEAHSAGEGGVHEFYNRVAMWPQSDPLGERRPRQRSQPPPTAASDDVRSWLARRSGYALLLATCLFIACGTVSGLRLMGVRSASLPSTYELMTHARYSRLAHMSPLSQATLPQELLGMRLIDFEQFATPGTTTGNPVTARWTYFNNKQTISIQSDAAYRGAVAIERQRVLDGSRVVERQQAVELQATAPETDTAAGSHKFRIESLTLDDPIAGRSYVTYTNWPIAGGAPETLPMSGDSWWRRLRSAVAYRPSSACVSLWLEGSLSQTKAEQEQLQQMLVQAAEMIRRVE